MMDSTQVQDRGLADGGGDKPACTVLHTDDPAQMEPGWSDANSAAANGEGWNLFFCLGSENGPWQLQRLDCADDVPGAPQLDSDDVAWRVVREGTVPHHAAALAFLKAHNPIEYALVKGASC